MGSSWYVLIGFPVWAVVTLIGMYWLAFHTHANLYRSEWATIVFRMLSIMAIILTIDIFWLGLNVDEEVVELGVLIHALILLTVSTAYEQIQRVISIPRKV